MGHRDENDYKRQQALSKILAFAHQFEPLFQNSSFSAASHLKKMRDELTSRRRAKQPGLRLRYWKKEEEEIRQDANRVLSNHGASRTTIAIVVGGQPEATKIKGNPDTGSRPYISVRLGYMWRHKVYKSLYKNNELDDSAWFVLAADQVRVNDPHAIVYEALLFNRQTGDTKDGYIGQCKVGNRKAMVRFTAPSAVSAAHELTQQELNRTLTGEKNHDKDQ